MTSKKSVIKFEGEFNLFVRIVKLVKENTLSVVLTLMLIFITGAMYLQFQFQQVQIDKIKNAVAPDESRIVVQKYEYDKKIDEILAELRDDLKADRAKLFQYHNSQRSVGNIPFLYVSATNEVVKRGISSELANLQRLPSSLFSPSIDNYFKNLPPCEYKKDLPDSAAKQYLEQQAVEISCNYPVYVNKDISGIVTINYNSIIEIDQNLIKERLAVTTAKISGILEAGQRN
jgi:hypothetical protein